MNFGKIMDIISENNINPEDVFRLVEKVKSSDLKDEKNIRSIIHEAANLAHKEIDPLKEDVLVKKIMSDGINEELLNLL